MYVFAPRKAVLLIKIPTKAGGLKRVSATGKDEKGLLPATKDMPTQEVIYPGITQEEIQYLIEIKHGHAKLFKLADTMPKKVEAQAAAEEVVVQPTKKF